MGCASRAVAGTGFAGGGSATGVNNFAGGGFGPGVPIGGVPVGGGPAGGGGAPLPSGMRAPSSLSFGGGAFLVSALAPIVSLNEEAELLNGSFACLKVNLEILPSCERPRFTIAWKPLHQVPPFGNNARTSINARLARVRNQKIWKW